MKNDPESRSRIHVGSIVQVTPIPTEALPNGVVGGMFMVVIAVETWGVRAGAPELAGHHGLTWDKIEATGGDAVFDPLGKRLVPEPPLRHHS